MDHAVAHVPILHRVAANVYNSRSQPAQRWAAAVIALFLAAPAYAVRVVVLKVDRSIPVGVSHANIGVTFTGKGWENGNPQAVARAERLVAGGLKYMSQSIINRGS